MSKQKPPKIVQLSPQGAWLWDQPEPVVVAPSPFGLGRRSPHYRAGPSPARLAELRQKYASMHWHKQLIRDNAAGRFAASLGREESEASLDTPLG
jgi:hypothetical protein